MIYYLISKGADVNYEHKLDGYRGGVLHSAVTDRNRDIAEKRNYRISNI